MNQAFKFNLKIINFSIHNISDTSLMQLNLVQCSMVNQNAMNQRETLHPTQRYQNISRKNTINTFKFIKQAPTKFISII